MDPLDMKGTIRYTEVEPPYLKHLQTIILRRVMSP